MILEVLSNSEHSGGYLFNIFNRSIDKIRKYESSENIKICSGVQEVYSSSDFTFICVKPQQSAPVFAEIRNVPQEHGIIVSTIAGKSLEELMNATEKVRVIRIMPTITAKISAGITAVGYSHSICEQEKKIFKKLLSPLGEIMDLEEEKFDAFTVLGSSGPAFVAFVLESFIDGAINIGVNPD